MYFDPNRPKEYNLKTLGPHHHHHTLVNKKVNNVNGENTMTVLVRGDNVFGTTVSKSFQRVNEHGEQTDGIDTVSISIASYRVVEVRK
jgi:predicted RND superfamily exporter protein